MTLIDQIVARVRDVVAKPGEVLLHMPLFAGNESKYVQQCIETGWVSSAGAFVTQFEQKLCAITGSRYAVATVNGTAALHMALMLAGVERDTEVLMPSLTFVATANAASYCGAIPHFCDVESKTLGVDSYRLDEHLSQIAKVRDGVCFNTNTSRRIAAIVPMHTFGHPVNIDALVEVAAKWNIPIVEDAAESLGSFYHNKHTGTFGKLNVLSFNGNKTITTGAGGAILTDDASLAARAKHLTTTAKEPHPFEYVHDAIGYNYRLPNLNAAMGVAQLEKLDDILRRKRRLALRYIEMMRDIPGVKVFTEPTDCRSNYWLNTLILDKADMAVRDQLLTALNAAGLQSRPIWRPMHQLAMFKECPAMSLHVTEGIAQRAVNVPSSPGLVGGDNA